MALSKSRAWLNKRNKDAKQKKDTFIRGWRVPYNRKFVHLFDYRRGKVDKSYLISDCGEIISFKGRTPQLIAQYNKNKYKAFNTGSKPDIYTHVAVMFSFMYHYYFVSKRCPKPQCSEVLNNAQDFKKFIDGRLKLNDIESVVHHKDEDKHNNKLSNLLLTYGDTHKAYHDIKKMKHDENPTTDLLSVTAKIKNRDIQKPTLFNTEGGSVPQIETLADVPTKDIENEFNTRIIYDERDIKKTVYDKWREKFDENLAVGLKAQCIKVEMLTENAELFYKIPKLEDWQDLPEEQRIMFDFIERIPRRERGILATVQY